MEKVSNELNLVEHIAFEPPIDIYQLSGGLSLILGSNMMGGLLSPAGTVKIILFSLIPKKSFQKLIGEHKELRILGRTRNSSAEELRSPISDNFSTAILNTSNRCAASVQQDYWAGIAVACHKNSNDSDGLKAKRLERQIGLVVARLEHLAKAYRTVMSVLDSGEAPHSLISNKYAKYLGIEYQSCLNELYGLRDATLAAAYRFAFGCRDAYSQTKLKNLVLNPPAAQNVAELITRSMYSQNGDLLLERMSLYRNIAQHCLGTTNPIFQGDVYQICISRGPFGNIPYLILPLYDDMDKIRQIERGSSKGIFQRLPREEAERFLNISPHQDALEFCFTCLERLLRICEEIAAETPISPEQIVITGENILRAEFRHRDGTILKFRRDESTGELVED